MLPSVCLWARARVRTGVEHVFAISYQLLISLRQRRGDRGKERKPLRQRESDKPHSGKGGNKFIPNLKKTPIIHLVLQGFFAFSLPKADREQPSRSWLHWFTCVCGRRRRGVYVRFNFYCLNTVGVDNFHFGFFGYLWGLRCREKCQHSFLT